MKIASLNIRGLGAVIKKRKIRDLVKAENIEFLAIQETEVGVVDHSLCSELWGSDDFNWSFSSAMGRSGGLLCIWDSISLSCIFSFFGPGFIGTCFEKGVNKIRCFVVNVYSLCDLAGKRKLWEDLKKSKDAMGNGLWCIVGDFNAITSNRERKGFGNYIGSQEVQDFRNWLNCLELVDPPLLGRKFTWYMADGSAMSRLDRFYYQKSGFKHGRWWVNGF